VLGDDHPRTLVTAYYLAVDLSNLGEHATARAILKDNLARRRRVLGDDQLDTLRSANNITAALPNLVKHIAPPCTEGAPSPEGLSE